MFRFFVGVVIGVSVLVSSARGQPASEDGSIEGDRAALVALYNATDGDNWTDKANWLSDKPLGKWFGVFTNAQGHVNALFLLSNELSGTIPSSLGNLSNLVILDLRDNELSGTIPSSFGNLTKLEWLILAFNNLSGTIPSSFGNLSNLIGFGVSCSHANINSKDNYGPCFPSSLQNWKLYEKVCACR